MHADTRKALSGVPPLDRRNLLGDTRPCKVCGAACAPFDVVDFNKFCDVSDCYAFGLSRVTVTYWRCASCGLLFTDFFDTWSQADFARFVYNDDYVKVDAEYVEIRPTRLAADFSRWLRGCEQARILDYGSGAGLFAAQMRAHGYAGVEEYDPFSRPQRPDGPFDIITCFEVVEHSTDPLATVADMLSLLADDGCLLFSQTVQPSDLFERRGGWWYLAPRNGHVSTYAEETLARIAARFRLTLHRGSTIYALVRQGGSDFARRAAAVIGPPFSTLRLFAPDLLPERRITSPGTDFAWWHPVRADHAVPFRWTGSRSVMWRAQWPELSVLEVRVPFVDEAWPDLGKACAIQLGDVRRPARVELGDLVAEFAVGGLREAVIELHLPVCAEAGQPADLRRGLAVPVRGGAAKAG